MVQRNSLAAMAAVTEHNQYRAHRRQWYVPVHVRREQPTKDEFREILMERLADKRAK